MLEFLVFYIYIFKHSIDWCVMAAKGHAGEKGKWNA